MKAISAILTHSKQQAARQLQQNPTARRRLCHRGAVGGRLWISALYGSEPVECSRPTVPTRLPEEEQAPYIWALGTIAHLAVPVALRLTT